MQTMRAPSYKAIAIAILRNDVNLYSLGLDQPHVRWPAVVSEDVSPQMELI